MHIWHDAGGNSDFRLSSISSRFGGRDQEVAPTEKRSVQQTITVESLNERVFIRIGIILIIHDNKDFQVISILTK